jgi:hypothetical protein
MRYPDRDSWKLPSRLQGELHEYRPLENRFRLSIYHRDYVWLLTEAEREVMYTSQKQVPPVWLSQLLIDEKIDQWSSRCHQKNHK